MNDPTICVVLVILILFTLWYRTTTDYFDNNSISIFDGNEVTTFDASYYSDDRMYPFYSLSLPKTLYDE